MKLADYVINFLADQGVKEVFLVYGAANGDLVDAFTRNDSINYVCVMHEQAGGFAAEGYAKIKGDLGVALATSGPGGQNFVTPIGNCFYDSVPCLFITGQINSRFLRPDESIRQIGFQETDIVGICKPISKYAKLILNPNDIKYELEKAVYLAKEGRPGPVLLDIPLDVQKADIDPDKLIGYDDSFEKIYNISKIESQIDQLLIDLKTAKRPCFLIGGGVRLANAIQDLLEIGKLLKIPMFPTWNALDIVCSDYEYYGGRVGTYGGAGRNFGIQNCDLLIGIGTRLSGRITGGNVSSFARESKKYVVDVDAPALQKKLQQLPFDQCILSDAKLFLELLAKKLSNFEVPNFSEWTGKVLDWKKKYDTVTDEMFDPSETIHPYAFTRILSEEMTSFDILAGDCGGNIVVINHAFETKIGQNYFTNNGNSPMGFSFAGAIGANLADMNRNTVCIIGDGGFNMNIQELQTVVNYKIPLKTIILDNRIYGITKAFQETNFQGRSEACGPTGYNPPDFVKVVNAYGIKTIYLENSLDGYESVRDTIKSFLSAEEAVVMVVNCKEYHTYEPKIVGWATPIEDMYPYLPREEFYSNMSIEPLECAKNPQMPSIFMKDTHE
jgi:acetolactate synthase-1/2/3 large subunit